MKLVLKSLEEVAEGLRGEYEARNGAFHLKMEGDVPQVVELNGKLTEFRDNNRTLNTTVAELQNKLKTFEGVDIAEYTTLKTKIADLEKGGVKKADDVAELVKQAVAAAVGPLQTKLTEREASEARAQEALARTALENQLREAGVKVGVDDRAMPDYINRGLQVFKSVDGKAVPRKGDAPIFSKKNVTEELSMVEWATELQNDAPFLFKPSKGGGAGGSTGTPGGFQGQRRVISSDPLEFGRNLEGIAKGEVVVQQ
ncbi:MAG: hypothetical protein JW395_0851 [Nitrospira sp.]|nr:hypothetical protein [Nitrospira sp.]